MVSFSEYISQRKSEHLRSNKKLVKKHDNRMAIEERKGDIFFKTKQNPSKKKGITKPEPIAQTKTDELYQLTHEPVPLTKSQPEPEPEPVPLTKSEPEPEPVPLTKSQPEPEPVPLTKSEPEPEPEPLTKSEPEPEPEPLTKSQPEPEPVPLTKSEPEPEPEPLTKSEPEPEPEPLTKSQPETEPQTESQPELNIQSLSTKSSLPSNHPMKTLLDIEQMEIIIENVFGVGNDNLDIVYINLPKVDNKNIVMSKIEVIELNFDDLEKDSIQFKVFKTHPKLWHKPTRNNRKQFFENTKNLLKRGTIKKEQYTKGSNLIEELGYLPTKRTFKEKNPVFKGGIHACTLVFSSNTDNRIHYKFRCKLDYLKNV